MIVIIYLTVALLVLMILHKVHRSSKVARLIDRIPGPTPIPFIGHALIFNIPTEKLWDMVLQLLDDYNPIVRVWSANVNFVITRNVDDIKTFLSCKQNIDKCEKLFYNGGKVFNNDGLVFSGGEKWRQRRKLISPAFGSNSMKDYIEIMNKHAERLVSDIKNQNIETAVIETMPVFLKLALGIVCEAVMGVDPSSFGVKEEENFRHSFDEINDLIVYRSVRPYLPYWIMKLFSGRKQDCVVKSLETFTDKVIQRRREYHERIGFEKLCSIVDHVKDEAHPDVETKRFALLDLLSTAKTKAMIDEKGVKEEAEVLILAGYETTGTAAAFALMLLAENKAIQDLAREEVTQLFEQTGGVLTMADVNSLDYLDRCIKETLRLYPSAPLIGRHITENINLKNYEIPQGTDILMHLYHLQRDPKYWSHPEKFDPDRFLPENVKERHPFAYQPFSAGPRACIGSKFAMLELKVIFAHLLYNFHMESIDLLANIKFKMHATLRPKTPCRVRLIGINRKSAV